MRQTDDTCDMILRSNPFRQVIQLSQVFCCEHTGTVGRLCSDEDRILIGFRELSIQDVDTLTRLRTLWQ